MESKMIIIIARSLSMDASGFLSILDCQDTPERRLGGIVLILFETAGRQPALLMTTEAVPC